MVSCVGVVVSICYYSLDLIGSSLVYVLTARCQHNSSERVHEYSWRSLDVITVIYVGGSTAVVYLTLRRPVPRDLVRGLPYWEDDLISWPHEPESVFWLSGINPCCLIL